MMHFIFAFFISGFSWAQTPVPEETTSTSLFGGISHEFWWVLLIIPIAIVVRSVFDRFDRQHRKETNAQSKE